MGCIAAGLRRSYASSFDEGDRANSGLSSEEQLPSEMPLLFLQGLRQFFPLRQAGLQFFAARFQFARLALRLFGANEVL